MMTFRNRIIIGVLLLPVISYSMQEKHSEPLPLSIVVEIVPENIMSFHSHGTAEIHYYSGFLKNFTRFKVKRYQSGPLKGVTKCKLIPRGSKAIALDAIYFDVFASYWELGCQKRKDDTKK